MSKSLARQIFERLSYVDLIVLFAAIYVLSVRLATIADDPGLGGHLANGANILRQRSIPVTDTLLADGAARSWVSDQWLSAVLLDLAYRLGGWPLLYSLTVVIFLLVFVYLPFRWARARAISLPAATFAAVLAFHMAEVHLIIRPVILSFFLFALVLQLANDLYAYGRTAIDNDGRSPVPRFAFVVLPLLSFLWANLHPSFIFAPLLVGVVAFGFLLRSVAALSDASSVTVVPASTRASAWIICALCFLLTLFNPYGIELHRSMLAQVGSPYLSRLMIEWQPLDFTSGEGSTFLALWAIVITALWIGDPRGRPNLFEFLTLGIFGLLACRSVRFLPYFSLVAVVPAARAVELLAQELARLVLPDRVRGWCVARMNRLTTREEQSWVGMPALLGVTLVVISGAVVHRNLPFFVGLFGPSEAQYPYEAVQFINEENGRSRQSKVLSVPDWGGFITWRGSGTIRALIDDRLALHGEQGYRAIMALLALDPGWEEQLARYDADYLLLPGRSLLGKYLKARDMYPLLHEDAVSLLFRLR